MRRRYYFIAMSTLLASTVAAAVQPGSADTYEFELYKERARTATKKVDLASLSKASTLGRKPSLVLKNASSVWNAPQKSNLTVRTGQEALSLLSNEYNRIYDFKNMKIYDLNTAAKTYCEHSLYADLAFRKAKLESQLSLRQMLGKFQGKRTHSLVANFFSEEQFELSLPGKSSDYNLQKSKDGAADIYKFNSVVVTSFTPGNQTIDGDKLRQFSRFLIYGTHLHPQIREDIERSGKLPQKLICYVDNHPVSEERTTFVLKKVTPGDFKALIPSGYTRTIDPRSPLSPIYPRIKELGGSPPADLQEQTLNYYQKALENKNYLDALLALSEYGLQTGENLKSEMLAIKDKIKDDSDCQKLISGLQAPENEKQAMISLGALDTIDRNKSSKSYLIDIFRANLIVAMNDHGINNLATKQDDDPGNTFVKALKHNPFIAGVYHDLGDYLESSYRQAYAWECYDLAHKFYPQHPFMKDIVEKEKELSDSFPQFFSGDKL